MFLIIDHYVHVVIKAFHGPVLQKTTRRTLTARLVNVCTLLDHGASVSPIENFSKGDKRAGICLLVAKGNVSLTFIRQLKQLVVRIFPASLESTGIEHGFTNLHNAPVARLHTLHNQRGKY